MTILLTADQHYGQRSIIGLCNRPFACVEEMDSEMIRMHNDRVTNSDDIYFLGDFCTSKDEKYVRHVFGRLKGRKHLVIGNHDNKYVMRLNWASSPQHKRLIKDDEGRTLVLSHYAERSWDRMYRGSFHFYGHTHGKLRGLGRSTDVGVDAWEFAPVTVDRAIERMMVWNPDFDDYAPEEKAVITGPEAAPSPAM